MIRNTVADEVLRALSARPGGMSDSDLAGMLGKNHAQINQVCHRLADRGLIVRASTPAGIVNKVREDAPPSPADIRASTVADEVLRALSARPGGMSDSDLAGMLGKNHAQINQVCHRLADRGLIVRASTPAGIVNKVREDAPPSPADIRANRKNIYVRDADLAVWDRAEQLAGHEPISALISRLLRNYVTQREVVEGRIVVRLQDRDANVTRKAIRGRRLVQHFESRDPAVTSGTQYFAAQGERGGLALWHQGSSDDYAGADSFSTYSSISEAAGECWPEDFLSGVAAALDEEYAEEIDL